MDTFAVTNAGCLCVSQAFLQTRKPADIVTCPAGTKFAASHKPVASALLQRTLDNNDQARFYDLQLKMLDQPLTKTNARFKF